jgi:hypothetical protein
MKGSISRSAANRTVHNLSYKTRSPRDWSPDSLRSGPQPKQHKWPHLRMSLWSARWKSELKCYGFNHNRYPLPCSGFLFEKLIIIRGYQGSSRLLRNTKAELQLHNSQPLNYNPKHIKVKRQSWPCARHEGWR